MLLLTLASFFSSGFSSYISDDWKVSKKIGNIAPTHGKWGDWYYCKEGQFATKLQVKVEQNPGQDDWTGLNGIRIACSDQNHRLVKNVQSAWADHGTWRYPWAQCEEGHFLTGMQMWTQPGNGGNDDSQANNIWGICNSPLGTTKEIKKTEIVEYKKHEYKGGRSGLVALSDECPPGYGITGFRSKVEAHCGGDCDDTAFNKVQFVCRKFPKCSHIAVTDIKLNELNRRIPNAAEFANKHGQNIRMKIGVIDNCESTEPLTWSGTQQNSHERTVEESYSSATSWEKTMGQSMTSEVGISIGHAVEVEAGLGHEMEFSWSKSRSRSFESTVSKSSEEVKSESVIKTKADETTNVVEVPPYNKWRIQTVMEAYTVSVDYTARAQCYRTKAMRHKIGESIQYSGVYRGVAVARETIKIEDVTGTCLNREGECKCANVFEDHGGNGGNIRAMIRDLLARQNGSGNAVDGGVGGEECTDQAVDPDLKAKGRFKDRGTWCYVISGTCKNENPITVDLDAGVDPEVFSWSKDPCKNVTPRSRRLELEELAAPLY